MSKAPTPREAAEIRLQYPPGTRMELELMVDAYAVPLGTRGTVDHVDNIGTIHMRWDNGRSLAVVHGVDSFGFKMPVVRISPLGPSKDNPNVIFQVGDLFGFSISIDNIL